MPGAALSPPYQEASSGGPELVFSFSGPWSSTYLAVALPGHRTTPSSELLEPVLSWPEMRGSAVCIHPEASSQSLSDSGPTSELEQAGLGSWMGC